MAGEPKPHVYPAEYSNPTGGAAENIAGRTPWETQLIHGARLNFRALGKTPYQPYEGQRVAPLHRLQEEAEKRHEQSLRRQDQSDTFRLMRQEIDQSRGRDISHVVQPYLQKASAEADPYIEKYMEKFMPYIQDMKNERREDFEKYAFPQIGAQFMGSNAYHSGARRQAEMRARQEFEKNLGREQNRVALEGYMAARGQHNKDSGLQGELAKIAGATEEKQKEYGLVSANALRNAEAAQTDQERVGNTQLGGYGYTRQEQTQREDNDKRKAHHENLDYPLDMATFEANLAAGHPGATHISSFTPAPAPPPPNYSAMGSEALRAHPGMAAAYPGRRSGGRVGHYAPGGQVLPPPYADSQLPAFNTPEMNQVKQTANELDNTHPNNAAYSMAIGAGASAAARAGKGSPWGSWGHGIQTQFENQQNVEQARYLNKERGANLMAKINDSRLDQHKVLHTYEQKKKDFEQKERLDASQIDLNQAHAQHWRNEGKIGKAAQPHIIDGQHISIDPETGKPVATPVEGFNRKKSVDEMRSRREAIATLGEATGVKHGVEEARKYNEKLSTGPVRGFIDNWLGENLASASGMGKVKDIEGFKRSVGNIFLHAHQGLKNIPRSEQFSKRIDDIKGSTRQVPEANKETFNEIYKTADLSEKVAMDTLIEMGMTKDEIMEKIKEFSSVMQDKETPSANDVDKTGSGYTREEVMSALG